ncbi:MAG: Flp family type IVb pilin [Alphaproteobacteria bacterium]|nr:Flp family type IVb pilin [Alphaproteobacteria bacterium]
MRDFLHFAQSSRGATTAEYGVIASIISMTIVGALASLAPRFSEMIEEFVDRLMM